MDALVDGSERYGLDITTEVILSRVSDIGRQCCVYDKCDAGADDCADVFNVRTRSICTRRIMANSLYI